MYISFIRRFCNQGEIIGVPSAASNTLTLAFECESFEHLLLLLKLSSFAEAIVREVTAFSASREMLGRIRHSRSRISRCYVFRT